MHNKGTKGTITLLWVHLWHPFSNPFPLLKTKSLHPSTTILIPSPLCIKHYSIIFHQNGAICSLSFCDCFLQFLKLPGYIMLYLTWEFPSLCVQYMFCFTYWTSSGHLGRAFSSGYCEKCYLQGSTDACSCLLFYAEVQQSPGFHHGRCWANWASLLEAITATSFGIFDGGAQRLPQR